MTKETQALGDYIASFNIDPRMINLKTITNTGYDEFMEIDGQLIPVFRPWPSKMDVPYLFQLGFAAVESEKNEVSD